MIAFPSAKINLGLHITGKRSDGYHNVETVLYPVGWCDALEVLPSANADSEFQLQLFNSDLNIATQDNICYKAYRLLKQEFNLPAIDCWLQKHIPHGAGLGGGSSDAAAMLKMLNELFKLDISHEKLSDFASQLGSDCPFFIYNVPSLATGRGEVLSPVSVSLKGTHLTIIKPQVSVSTKEAYSDVKPSKPDLPLESVIMLQVAEWKYSLVNDFEITVFKKHGILRELKAELYRQGALYASMSGSGSALYALSEKKLDVSTFSGFSIWQELL